jgi:hypothetical protein
MRLPPLAVLLSLILYDYLLTLTREIDLVWFSQWNIIKIVFLVQRYVPFIDGILLAIAGKFASSRVFPS